MLVTKVVYHTNKPVEKGRNDNTISHRNFLLEILSRLCFKGLLRWFNRGAKFGDKLLASRRVIAAAFGGAGVGEVLGNRITFWIYMEISVEGAPESPYSQSESVSGVSDLVAEHKDGDSLEYWPFGLQQLVKKLPPHAIRILEVKAGSVLCFRLHLNYLLAF